MLRLGNEIGRGGSRICYALDDRPGYVVKIPHGRNRKRHQYNVIEGRIWSHAPDDLREWLVPVSSYCPNGEWLIMERGEPITDEQRPKSAHRWLHDWRKVNNWVEIRGRVLLCDYGQRHIAKHMKLNIELPRHA